MSVQSTSSSFATPVQVTQPPCQYSNDFRPAVGPDNDVVVFERRVQIGDGEGGKPIYQTKLFWCRISDGVSAGCQIFDDKLHKVPPCQTRADWSATGNIVFNAASSDANIDQQVWVINQSFFLENDPSSLAKLPIPGGYLYPRWGSVLGQFVCSNYRASMPPVNSWFDQYGIDHYGLKKEIVSLDGSITESGKTYELYGGMAAISPVEGLPCIAFAGQAYVSESTGDSYNQVSNYIYVNQLPAGDGPPSSCNPVDAAATVGSYTRGAEGRAPDWSPDGKSIAFESNRTGGGIYAIWFYDVSSSTSGLAPTQLTSPTESGVISGNANHPKFFPDGTKIIFSSDIALKDGTTRQAILYIPFSNPSDGG